MIFKILVKNNVLTPGTPTSHDFHLHVFADVCLSQSQSSHVLTSSETCVGPFNVPTCSVKTNPMSSVTQTCHQHVRRHELGNSKWKGWQLISFEKLASWIGGKVILMAVWRWLVAITKIDLIKLYNCTLYAPQESLDYANNYNKQGLVNVLQWWAAVLFFCIIQFFLLTKLPEIG